jgi:hypothetical protein
LPDFESAALVTLVTASVFTTTLVSARRHEAKSRALEGVFGLEAKVRPGLQEEPHPTVAPLIQQERLLREADVDWFGLAILAMNCILLVGLIFVLVRFGLTWNPFDSIALATFLVVEILVVSLGSVDAYLVHRDLHNKLLLNPAGLAAEADKDLVAGTRPSRRRPSWYQKRLRRRALTRAAAAARATTLRFPYALTVLGFAELAAIMYDEDSWDDARRQPAVHLSQAIDLGGTKPHILGALAVAHTRLPDRQPAKAIEELVGAVESTIHPRQSRDPIMKEGLTVRPKIKQLRDAGPFFFKDPDLWDSAADHAIETNEYDVALVLLSILVRNSDGSGNLDSVAGRADRVLEAIESEEYDSAWERAFAVNTAIWTLLDLSGRLPELDRVLATHADVLSALKADADREGEAKRRGVQDHISSAEQVLADAQKLLSRTSAEEDLP